MWRPWVIALVAACTYDPQAVSSDATSGDGSTLDTPMSDGSSDAPVTCSPNTNCDDQLACTEHDTCLGGTCTGVPTNTGPGCVNSCGPSCGACAPGGCCTQDCGGGSCACTAGCDCDVRCTANSSATCTLICSAGSACFVDGPSDGEDRDYDITCNSGSSCAVECNGDQGTCNVICNADATCVQFCNYLDGTCNMTCNAGTAVDCGGGVTVCHRPCP